MTVSIDNAGLTITPVAGIPASNPVATSSYSSADTTTDQTGTPVSGAAAAPAKGGHHGHHCSGGGSFADILSALTDPTQTNGTTTSTTAQA